MTQRTFGDGYLAGWRSVRGDDQVPTVPAYCVSEGSASEGEAPHLAGSERASGRLRLLSEAGRDELV
jgi:hypothetical protein